MPDLFVFAHCWGCTVSFHKAVMLLLTNLKITILLFLFSFLNKTAILVVVLDQFGLNIKPLSNCSIPTTSTITPINPQTLSINKIIRSLSWQMWSIHSIIFLCCRLSVLVSQIKIRKYGQIHPQLADTSASFGVPGEV